MQRKVYILFSEEYTNVRQSQLGDEASNLSCLPWKNKKTYMSIFITRNRVQYTIKKRFDRLIKYILSF